MYIFINIFCFSKFLYFLYLRSPFNFGNFKLCLTEQASRRCLNSFSFHTLPPCLSTLQLTMSACVFVCVCLCQRELCNRKSYHAGAIDEEQQRNTSACLRETHLGIERKCSSMTASSTSSLEAEVDFTVLMDLHPTEAEKPLRALSEPGGREQEHEMGQDDFEETSRFYLGRLIGSLDVERLPEELTLSEVAECIDDLICRHQSLHQPTRLPAHSFAHSNHPFAKQPAPSLQFRLLRFCHIFLMFKCVQISSCFFFMESYFAPPPFVSLIFFLFTQ